MNVVPGRECKINYDDETKMYVVDQSPAWNVFNDRAAAVNAKGCLTFRNLRNPAAFYSHLLEEVSRFKTCIIEKRMHMCFVSVRKAKVKGASRASLPLRHSYMTTMDRVYTSSEGIHQF